MPPVWFFVLTIFIACPQGEITTNDIIKVSGFSDLGQCEKSRQALDIAAGRGYSLTVCQREPPRP